MSSTVDSRYAVAHLNEIEPAPRVAPGADGRERLDVRRRLGITAFGVGAFSAPEGVDVIGGPDEASFGEGGERAAYWAGGGKPKLGVEGEGFDGPAGPLVRVQPTAKRKATAA